MTDFLSNLVDRTLARAPVLERRRPSLFEPSVGMAQTPGAQSESQGLESEQETVLEVDASAGGGGAVESTSTTLKLDAESIRPALPEANAEKVRIEQGPRASSTQATRLESEARQRERKQSPATLHPASEPGATTQEEETGRPAARSESTDAQSFTTAPLSVTETIVEREVEVLRFPEPSERLLPERNRTPKAATPAAPPAITRLVVQPVTQGPNDEKRDGSLPEQKLESRASIEPRPVVRKELPRPVAPVRAQAALQAQPAVANAAPAEPTVQVTIGRIEVRAAPQPARARAPKPATPKLSLEDYLKARGGGNR